MSSLPDDVKNSPELSFSEVCVNLESKFDSMQDLNKGEKMNIYARIRPMLYSEKVAGYKECVGLLDEQIVRVKAPVSSSKFKINSHLCQDIIEDFTFTAAYGPETGQFVFFQECMMDTMKSFIEGQNNLVFSYGTTGSGKTFTLQGDMNNPGIIPLSLHLFFASVEDQLLDQIFFKPDKFIDIVALNDNEIKKELENKEQLLSSCNQEENNLKSTSVKSLGMMLCETFSDHFEGEHRQTTLSPDEMAQAQAATLMKEISKKSAKQQSGYCSIWVSFAEIYNENIYDLLHPNSNQRTKLCLGEDKNGDVYVKGLREVWVANSYEALNLLNLGQRNLRIASTKLNYQSSRSHCIFTVKVIRIPDPKNMTCARVNRLSFCDLAGSERAAKSQTSGMRLKEAGCINTSLLVLGRCLEQLRLNPSQRDKKLIPFRESKLTRLFSGFFTGRGKAVMITNASPCELTFDETLHVLRFSAVAKELIINDSYITSASNTLQSITNMWTDVKSNCKNQSQFSSKSISFEDSMDEVLQEKDELIEKLLDLAESLKSNLEQEKKDKAEMEIKIRQDTCIEYTEFRDELLEMQKLAFEEEKEAIKEIYEKRIASLEKHYGKVISDFKLHLEDSFSTDDENSKDATQNAMKQSDVNENAPENETPRNSDSHFKCNEASMESKKTVEELLKTVDHSLSLEVEIEHLGKKYETVQSKLENSMMENDHIKKELDACKLEVLTLKTDNEVLLNKKLDLEADLKAFKEDLVTVTQEKEVVFQELTEIQKNLPSLNNKIVDLLEIINDLTLEKEEEDNKHKKSMEEINMKNHHLTDQLFAISEELEAEKIKKEELKSIISAMEQKISAFQSTEQENFEFKNTIKSLSVELENLKNENMSLKEQLKVAEASKAASYQFETGTNNEIEILKAVHLEEIEKLNNALRKCEADAKEAEEILRSVNKILGNSQEVIEQQKQEMNLMREECTSLKKELLQMQSTKDDLVEKVESSVSNLELEKQKRSELVKELEIQAAKFDSLQSDYLVCKNEVANLTKINFELEEKLLFASEESESAKNFCQQMKSEAEKLKEALNTINSQNKEIEQLRCENRKYLDELVAFKKEKRDLENKLESNPSQNGIYELVLVLQNCEFEATRKIEELQANVEKLKENFVSNSINHEKECAVLHELIAVLEKCEAFASNRMKHFHSTNIQFVEQIMDLENSLKSKEKIIHILNTDVKDMQKKYKDLQTSSKKQLQVETQELNSVIEKMKIQLADFKKLNESLKYDFAKLEADKDKIETEYEIMKAETAKKTKENHEEKRKNRRILQQSQNISEDSMKTEISEIQEKKRRNNKKTTEKSIVVESKKVKTEIYEETDENASNENTKHEKRIGRNYLKCLSNITDEQSLNKRKQKDSSKNETSKRKADSSEYDLPEKKVLKKIKMQNVDNAENSNKPQNLRIVLLKNSLNVNDIPLPSPRMTRGRKRLVLAKELSTSPRTLRS